jgi:DNA-binding HxlR family transcriptional regulator
MSSRTYGQYCPIAAALDVLGDRWNLLVLRELSFGPQRFTDLRSALPGIAPNLLTERLRDLEQAGLVCREELPPPTARTVYVLSDEGREVRPVLASLAKFGAARLPTATTTTAVRPRAALVAALTSFHDPRAATAIDEQYRVIIDDEIFELRCSAGRLRRAVADVPPALTLTAAGQTLIQIRQGQLDLGDAIADGTVTVVGSKRALARFCLAFSLRGR